MEAIRLFPRLKALPTDIQLFSQFEVFANIFVVEFSVLNGTLIVLYSKLFHIATSIESIISSHPLPVQLLCGRTGLHSEQERRIKLFDTPKKLVLIISFE